MLTAADNEEHGVWSDGRAMFSGDFMNTYAYPALVYGIALGMCILAGAPVGVPDDQLAEVTR